jgi:formamidopyrimidine-DNA glycosylase
VADLPDRSTRIEFVLSGGAKLFFNDQRKFGWVKLLPTMEVENIDFLKKVGPEPLSGDKQLPRVFLKNVRRRNNTTIKAALLDQTVIAGIGNIYADESLWAAKVHPATRVRDLSDRKLRDILQAAITVMSQSIASGGSTMKNYIRADGSKGNYLEKFAKVFRRDGLACPRCGEEIIKIRVAGRGTHLCPKCQKEPK